MFTALFQTLTWITRGLKAADLTYRSVLLHRTLREALSLRRYCRELMLWNARLGSETQWSAHHRFYFLPNPPAESRLNMLVFAAPRYADGTTCYKNLFQAVKVHLYAGIGLTVPHNMDGLRVREFRLLLSIQNSVELANATESTIFKETQGALTNLVLSRAHGQLVSIGLIAENMRYHSCPSNHLLALLEYPATETGSQISVDFQVYEISGFCLCNLLPVSERKMMSRLSITVWIQPLSFGTELRSQAKHILGLSPTMITWRLGGMAMVHPGQDVAVWKKWFRGLASVLRDDYRNFSHMHLEFVREEPFWRSLIRQGGEQLWDELRSLAIDLREKDLQLTWTQLAVLESDEQVIGIDPLRLPELNFQPLLMLLRRRTQTTMEKTGFEVS